MDVMATVVVALLVVVVGVCIILFLATANQIVVTTVVQVTVVGILVASVVMVKIVVLVLLPLLLPHQNPLRFALLMQLIAFSHQSVVVVARLVILAEQASTALVPHGVIGVIHHQPTHPRLHPHLHLHPLPLVSTATK